MWVRSRSLSRPRRDARPRRLARRRPPRHRARHLRPVPRYARDACTLDGAPIAPASPAEAMAQRRRLRIEPAGRGGRSPSNLDGAREHLHQPGGERPARVGSNGRARERAQKPRPPFGASPSRRRASRSRSRRCPAAISRRSCSRAGWRPSEGCSSSRSRRSASTSARRRRSTSCLQRRCARDWRSS